MPERAPDVAPDVIVGLRVVGADDGDLPLPAHKDTFTLGKTGCDLCIDSVYLSASHCTIIRRGPRLEVVDLHSKNGITRDIEREAKFEVKPGEVWKAARTQLLVMSERMVALRPTIAAVVGLDAHREVDQLLRAAATEKPILVYGKPGSGQEQLAAAIHRLSPLRAFSLVQGDLEPAMARDLVDSDRPCTLACVLTGTRIPDSLLSALFDPDRHIRIIAFAESARAAARALGGNYVGGMHEVELLPLRRRKSELERLFDRELALIGASFHFRDMTAANRSSLLSRTWTGGHERNLDALRACAQRIAALAPAGADVAKAAEAVAIQERSLVAWLGHNKFSLPIIDPTSTRRSP